MKQLLLLAGLTLAVCFFAKAEPVADPANKGTAAAETPATGSVAPGIPELAQLQTLFDNEVHDKTDSDYVAGTIKLNEAYQKALEGSLKKAASAGLLDETLVMKEELTRFSAAGVVPDSDAPGIGAGIARMREAWRAEMRRLQQQRADAMKPLVEAYDARLQKLEVEFTKALKLEEAKAVRETRNRFGKVSTTVFSPVPIIPINLPAAMKGRVGNGRMQAMALYKMKPKAEQAVIKGLLWLQKNQNLDGSWGDSNKGAMTGFGLLCFLGHGETPGSQQFGTTVNKSVQWILDNGTKHEGRLHMANSFNQSGVYEHGICTYALGEYYTMTKDARVEKLFKQAIGYIVQGQGQGGGWMYSYDKTADDLSVSGWQIQALKIAHLSELGISGVDQALDKAIAYIDRVRGPKGGYGYRGPSDKYSLTGVGILCQLFWKGERGVLRKGMEWLLEETEKDKPVKYKGDSTDLYAWYYHTQACLMFGGSAWTKWNGWFQDELCDVQNPDGSWPAPGARGNGRPQTSETVSGQVYRTSLCILMLEVFYRYMPTAQR